MSIYKVTPYFLGPSNRESQSAVVHISVSLYRMSQEERSIFWELIISAVLSKIVHMCMCPIPNSFRGTAILLYSSKTVDKKETLRTVSNTGIYFSSGKFGTVYLV
jgi:hypothetical protein